MPVTAATRLRRLRLRFGATLCHRVLPAALVLAAGMACAAERELRLVTTTTTDNSGLIAHLVPAFEGDAGYRVKVIAVGTGRALRLLERGDVDVSLTHARDLEAAVRDAGGGVDLHPVMYNDFVLVGAPDDPAGARAAATAPEAFARVARRGGLFVSRGDRSGTHVREDELWRAAGIEPAGEWYRSAGQGMGKTLQIAGELGAYTLVDRGTWLAFRHRSPLAVTFQGDARLMNIYSVMSVNAERYPDANGEGAAAFSAWLRSARAKTLIRSFLVDGQLLFVPVL